MIQKTYKGQTYQYDVYKSGDGKVCEAIMTIGPSKTVGKLTVDLKLYKKLPGGEEYYYAIDTQDVTLRKLSYEDICDRIFKGLCKSADFWKHVDEFALATGEEEENE